MTDPTTSMPIDPVAIRIANGWSQAEMAAQLGCNQSTVSRIETGSPINGSIRRLYEIIASNASLPGATEADGGFPCATSDAAPSASSSSPEAAE